MAGRTPSLWIASRVLLALPMAMSAIILIACTGNGRVDGPVLSSPRQPFFGGGGNDAEVGGTVFFDEDSGCLYLGHDEYGTPVVWPHGASWQADPPAVILQGNVIEPGMSVMGAGGYHKHQQISRLAGAAVADAAEACAVDPHWDIAFFNRSSRVKALTGD